MTNKVAEPSRNSAYGSAKIKKIRDLRGGVEAMRAAGEAYLPKEENEEQHDYDDRLKRSWLFPALDQAISDAADTVFRKEVSPGDDVPEQLIILEPNITNEGRNLNNFAFDVFEDGLEAGVSFILVDMPAREGELTRQDQQALNIRPYWSLVRAEDVLGWKTSTVNNNTVLSQIRILETAFEDDTSNEFEQTEVAQVRVITRDMETGVVSVALYRKDDKGKDWVLFSEVFTGLDVITVVPFYTERSGFFTADPPFENLADLNIAHWQSASDQRNILHNVRVPKLFMKGMDADELGNSPNTAIIATSPEADAKWLEHGGKAIDSGRQDLLDLEDRMHQVGLQIITRPVANTSATDSDNSRQKETTALGQWANNLKEALEQALQFSADYLNIEDGGSIEVNKDFRSATSSSAELQFLLNAVNTGQISQKTFLKESIRRGLLMDDMEVDKEIERIADASSDEAAFLDLEAEEIEETENTNVFQLIQSIDRLNRVV